MANILRRLADYVDHRSDEELGPIFDQAAKLMHEAGGRTKSHDPAKRKLSQEDVKEISTQLQTLPSREVGEDLLREKATNRIALEAIARFLQLPVQRDDTIDRLRAKIVENTIGSRLRSDAIQGKDRS